MASVVDNLKTVVSSAQTSAVETANTHAGIMASIEAEAANLRASAERLDGKVMKEAETVFTAFKSEFMKVAGIVESDVEAAWTRAKQIL